MSTVFWALVLFAVAVYSVRAGGKGNVVEIGLSIASVAYGCLLGVFLLGVLTRYATEWGAIVGMVDGLSRSIWRCGSFPDACCSVGMSVPKVAWTWYVLDRRGRCITFAVGLAASMVLRMRKQGRAEAAAVAMMIVARAALCASRARTASRSPRAGTDGLHASNYRTTTSSAVATAAINTAAIEAEEAAWRRRPVSDTITISSLSRRTVCASLPASRVWMGSPRPPSP